MGCARFASAIAFLGFLCSPVHAQTGGEGLPAIRAKNEGSVVFIHSVRIRKDGGIPQHNYGTGFVISKDGHVLTAAHVIFDSDEDSLVQNFGAVRSRHNHAVKLELVKKDKDIDVALLVLPDTGDRRLPVTFGDSRQVPKDASLYTLGFPGPSDLSSAAGLLSSKSGPKGVWQTTLAINRGNSGGPVFDYSGKVVAMAAAGDDSQQQVTFAVPEAYMSGLRQMAGRMSDWPVYARLGDDGWAMIGSPASGVVKTKFAFYEAVSADEKKAVSQSYCVPDGFKITQVNQTVTAKAGTGTRVVTAEKDPARNNCVLIAAEVEGQGVSKVGPIVVDHVGRGWLALDIDVKAVRDSGAQ